MSNHFGPFIKPSDGWEIHKRFGEKDETQPGSLILASHVRTEGENQLYAAVGGKLTLYPPLATVPPYEKGKNSASRPTLGQEDTVTLYLSPQFEKLSFGDKLDFLESSQHYHRKSHISPELRVNYLRYFVYFNVSLTSVRQALFPELDVLQQKPNLTEKDRENIRKYYERWGNFLTKGKKVESNQPIGRAGPAPTGNGWQAGFAIVTKQGPFDPGTFYEKVGLNYLTDLLKKRWGQELIPSTGPKADTIYPYSALLEYKNRKNLTYNQWRKIGDQQKKLYLRRLHQRVRPGTVDQNIPQFNYDMDDLFNIFQLEAVTQFYMNFDNPWALESSPPDVNECKVNLLALYGNNADVSGEKRVKLSLERNPDEALGSIIQRITPGLDVFTVWELDDTGVKHPTQYRILGINKDEGTMEVELKLDSVPNIPSNSRWTISHRPSLVLIDAFGYRVAGTQAIRGDSNTQIRLKALTFGQLEELKKVNPHFDTISLPLTGTHRRDFRIEKARTELVNRAHLTLYEAVTSLPETGVKWTIKKKSKNVKDSERHQAFSGLKATKSIGPNTITLQDIASEDISRLKRVIKRVRLDKIEEIVLTINDEDKTFRIQDATQIGEVVLDLEQEAAQIPDDGIDWSIPSGLGGAAGLIKRPSKSVHYGWDHYDGMMFVVLNGNIEDTIPWTSYSARVKNKKSKSHMSSVRGNRRYIIRSFLSSKHSFIFRVVDEQAHITGTMTRKRNVEKLVYKLDHTLKDTLAFKKMYKMVYSKKKKKKVRSRQQKLEIFTYADGNTFKKKRSIIHLNEAQDELTLDKDTNPLEETSWSMDLYDGVHEAFYYFKSPLKDDSCPFTEVPPYGKKKLGKGLIRLHTGYIYSKRTGTGSEGCLVSPYYYYLRNLLTQHHITEYNYYYADKPNRIDIENVRSALKNPPSFKKYKSIHKRIMAFKERKSMLQPLIKRVNELLEAENLSDDVGGLLEELYLITERLDGDLAPPGDVGDEVEADLYLQLLGSAIEVKDDPLISDTLIGDSQKIQDAFTELERNLKQLEKQLYKERQRLGWDDIIIGELWLIRPDEGYIPEAIPTP